MRGKDDGSIAANSSAMRRWPAYNVRTMRTRLLRGLFIVGCLSTLAAQETPIRTMADGPLAERGSALYRRGDLIGAMPIYEELAKRHPESPAFAEALAFCLAGAAQNNPDATAGAAQWEQAGKEAEHARHLGDNSQLEQVILATTKQPLPALNQLGTGDAKPLFASAEHDFAHGDLESAFKKYSDAYAIDPHFYEAALYAGDVEFRRGNLAQAGTWFARAIVINPNRETAFRYWGDALDKAGQVETARDKFIAALIAEPYNVNSLMGLTNWAKRNGYILRWPEVHLPPGPKVEMKSGKEQTTVTINAATNSEDEIGAWMLYQGARMNFRKEKFAKAFPDEKTYRHSLKEEQSAIELALKGMNDRNPQISPTLKTLLKLQREDLLAAWILLSEPDAGIVQDYDAYRDGHREQLTRYVRDYLIHPGVKDPGH